MGRKEQTQTRVELHREYRETIKRQFESPQKPAKKAKPAPKPAVVKEVEKPKKMRADVLISEYEKKQEQVDEPRKDGNSIVIGLAIIVVLIIIIGVVLIIRGNQS